MKVHSKAGQRQVTRGTKFTHTPGSTRVALRAALPVSWPVPVTEGAYLAVDVVDDEAVTYDEQGRLLQRCRLATPDDWHRLILDPRLVPLSEIDFARLYLRFRQAMPGQVGLTWSRQQTLRSIVVGTPPATLPPAA